VSKVSPVYRARHEGFSDGVLLALQVMHAAGNTGGHDYVELLRAADKDAVIKRARNECMLRITGLSQYLKESAHDRRD